MSIPGLGGGGGGGGKKSDFITQDIHGNAWDSKSHAQEMANQYNKGNVAQYNKDIANIYNEGGRVGYNEGGRVGILSVF